ncbi:hypothetical protein Ddye_009668 [Dipteronia dyeriana]|uniref:RNase H type-1 domain-containing protein n=1 Tax=Dipteronia dyeriana TaxID=168575 RepID=A0AAD9XCF8_9ROSI|nr:hypothetical protein Ddye_009668 [Dipteronia dyeriana]
MSIKLTGALRWIVVAIAVREGVKIRIMFSEVVVSIAIWEDIWKGVTKTSNYNINWEDWLLQNLKCNKLFLNKWPNFLVFAITLSFMWKWRCESVFNHEFKLPSCPGKIILQFIIDWVNATNALDKNSNMTTYFLSWIPPSQDWVKLNVNGNMLTHSNVIVAGGVFRDCKKDWLGGFALNKGIGSVVEAELWGIFRGIKIAWKHVYRECNRVADDMACLGHSLGLDTIWFDNPSTQIVDLLEDDVRGTSSVRSIPSF